MSSLAVGFPGESIDQVYAKVRARADVDLHYMAHFFFGLTFFDAPFHQRLAGFMSREDIYPRTLILAPRGGGKSAYAAIRKIQRFLRNPDTRQLHVSYGQDMSSAFAKQLLSMLLASDRGGRINWIKVLYPKIYAAVQEARSKRALTQSEWYFPSLMTTSRKDPQFKWSSIDSGITGLHVDCLDGDDIIDEVHARSPADCRRAIDWLGTAVNVLEHQTRTPFHIIGTHYHLQDPYAHIIENLPDFTTFIHPALINEYDENYNIVLSSYWPSKFTVDELLKQKALDPVAFAALMQQNPTQREDAPFKEEHIRYWEWLPGKKEVMRHDGVAVPLSELTIVEIYDPALGSKKSRAAHAIVIEAMDSDGFVYLLDYWESLKSSVEQSIPVYVMKAQQWDPTVCACEDVLFQSLIIPALRREAKAANIAAYNITPVNPSGRSKDTRILALMHWFTEGRVMVHRSHAVFIEQLLAFPFGKRRDLLDAFAYGPDVLYPPQRTTVTVQGLEFPRDLVEKVQRKIGRNPVTGY